MATNDSPSKQITNSERALIIKKYEKNASIKRISEEMKINRNSFASIIRLFKKRGRFEVKSIGSLR